MKKYVTVLFDGMADYPDTNGRTPMKEAFKPITDAMAQKGEVGLCKTVPNNMKPGSDVANLSVMGYAPEIFYTGRSPLEALSIGVEMSSDSVTYRCNLVTLSNDEPYENKTMVDYSAGEITTEEAKELIEFLDDYLPLGDNLKLYPGVSYRHCLLRKVGLTGATLVPPHDISDKKITDFLPSGGYADELLELMKLSNKLLSSHPINVNRVKRGLNPANSIWLWGEGRKPALEDFYTLHGKKGAVISAVDLLKGIGKAANMEVIEVEGATGNIDTNFDGKATAAIDALSRNDYVYIHLEAPDECGHQGSYETKKRAIELIDEKIVGPVKAAMDAAGYAYKIAVLPDHATPVTLKTHVSDPVPYLIYDNENELDGVPSLTEENATNTGISLDSGVALMNKLFD